MTRAHYDAFQARLPAGLKFHRGTVAGALRSADYPYVVLGGGGGDESTEALAGNVDSLEFRLRATYAGLTFDSVLVTVDRVRRAFLDSALVVPGWSCGTVRQNEALSIQRDSDVTLPDSNLKPLFAVDEFTVFCTR